MVKKVLVITGVGGLIGSRYAKFILDNYQDKYIVVGIDDFSGGYVENVPKDVFLLTLNLTTTSQQEIEKRIKFISGSDHIDYIAHFAAYAAEGLSPFIRTYNYTNNLLATTKLINIAIKHNVERFLFTSSMAVYGDQPDKLPYNEGLQPQPIDPYGIAKYACEMDLKCAYKQHDLKYTIIRPHNVFGDNQNIWDVYRNVLGIWMYQKLNNLPLTIYGDGEQTRAFTFIDNILEPLYQAMTKHTTIDEIINLGGKQEMSLNHIAKLLVEEVFQTPTEIVYMKDRFEAKHAYPTYQKSVNLIGYEETSSLLYGLKSMWKWCQTQPMRIRHKWDEYELEKNIYDCWK